MQKALSCLILCSKTQDSILDHKLKLRQLTQMQINKA